MTEDQLKAEHGEKTDSEVLKALFKMIDDEALIIRDSPEYETHDSNVRYSTLYWIQLQIKRRLKLPGYENWKRYKV